MPRKVYVGVHDVARRSKRIYLGIGEAVKERSLPSGYTQLSYIQSSGTQYIDTEFFPNQDTKVVMDFASDGVPADYSAGLAGLFGARNNSSSSAFVVWIADDRAYPHYGNVSHSANGYISINTKQRLQYVLDKNILLVAGETKECGSAIFSASCKLCLLGPNTAGTVDTRRAIGKLYACQIYDNGTLVRDYVPCLNPSNEVGLYDIVNDVFYGNDGTGYFLPGSVVNPSLPNGYTRVLYIESHGEEYIDTGFKPKNSSRVVCKFKFTKPTATQYLFCARGASSGYANRFGLLLHSSGYFRSDYGSTNLNFPTDLVADGEHEIDFNMNTCTIDGTSVNHTESNFTSAYNMNLFAGNTGGNTSELAFVRIYSCKIYDNDTLVRYYVPCINSSGVAGLYDIVNSKFYANAGTGSFTFMEYTEGIAKKVLKGYVGVDGKAFRFFPGGGGAIEYEGTITPLSVARYYLAAGSIPGENYALFAGGMLDNKSTPTLSAVVDAYDRRLTRTLPTVLSVARTFPVSAQAGDKLLFAGGATKLDGGTCYDTVDVYDKSLTRTTTALSAKRTSMAGASLNDKAIFAGGFASTYSAVVDVFDASLTLQTLENLSLARRRLGGCSLEGHFAIFGGGAAVGATAGTDVVDAYDTSLTKVAVSEGLNGKRYNVRGASNKNYAMFAGGSETTGRAPSDSVEAYDASLTRTLPEVLQAGRYNPATVSTEYNAVFGGGTIGVTSGSTNMAGYAEAYDLNLVRTILTNLSVGRYNFDAAVVNDHILFGGGVGSNVTGTTGEPVVYDTVDVYSM